MAWLCSRIGCSWLLYLWAFVATALTNSIFTGIQVSYRTFPDLVVPTWWAYMIFFGVVFTVMLLDIFLTRTGRIYIDRYIVYVFIYIGTTILSLVINRGAIWGNEPFFQLIKLIVPLLIGMMMIQRLTINNLPRVFMVFTAFAIVNLPVAFVEIYINRALLATSHISGVFSDRNLFSRFLVMVHAWLLIGVLSERPRRLLSMKTATLAAIFICITFLLSRSGYLLYLIATGMVLIHHQSARLKRMMPFFIAGALVLFGAMFLIRVRAEQMNVSNASDIGRASTILAGINMVKASPVFGVGYGLANPRFMEFQDRHFPGLRDAKTIHLIYLNVWAEQGIIGLAAFVLFNFSLVFALHRACRKKPLAGKKELLVCYIALTVHLVHGLFYHSMDYEGVYWIVIACSIIALRDTGRTDGVNQMQTLSKAAAT
jgi:O-antigen ligase